ncbi:uncharacterized protein LOC125196525 [Salvia hispanica]|uniref:uncharacterized protein LOC125196525 n=1 Tax=Salvia hispanica TaxID=49212 RepID=UPI00200993ED|nr:uncharacterized protein LOC125196525 [Salvia hispanica]
MAVRDVPLINLIQLTLAGCSECEQIPRLEHLTNLKSLSLIGLKKVMHMNSSFCNLMSLTIRDLEGLESLPHWLFLKNRNLSKLEIIGCAKLEKLPYGLDTLDSLEELNITKCQNMKMIVNPCDGERLYAKGILRVLRIVGCGELRELPRQMVELWVPLLEVLELFELRSLKNLPVLIGCLAKSARLRELKIGCVPQLMNTCCVESWHFGNLQKVHLDVSWESTEVTEEKGNDFLKGRHFGSLQKLHLDVSGKSRVSIENVNDILQGCCNSLTQLCLLGKEIWERVPESIQHLTLLSKLELHNLGIEELPEWFGKLSYLSKLSLSSCIEMKRLLSWETLEGLTELRVLDIKDCPKLRIGFEGRNTSHLTIKIDNSWIKPYTNEIVDGGISSAATEFLLKSLGNTFKLEKNSGNVGVNGDIEQLQKTLVTVQSYLNDAQNKSIGEDDVKVWLIMLQQVAFAAGNVSDEFNYSALHSTVKKLKSKAKYKALSRLPSFNQILRQIKIASMIKDINMVFESMIQMAEDFGVQSKRGREPDAADASASSDSFTVDPIFFGRDINPIFLGRGNDVQKLVETDIPGDTIFSIIAIVGKAGLGKETLARTVINHEEVKARFGSYVWVHVSRNFDPIVILKKILYALTSETNIGEVETEESILKKLQQALKGKTYILVLNDLWNEDDLKWKKFINSISRVTSMKGNAIIITTRESKVASLVKPLHTYALNGLSDEDCWSIIKAKAFPNGDDRDLRPLETKL